VRIAWGVLCLWFGAACIWVAAHGTDAVSPWGVYEEIIDGIRNG
jgi:hypothetical protein